MLYVPVHFKKIKIALSKLKAQKLFLHLCRAQKRIAQTRQMSIKLTKARMIANLL